MAHPAPFIQVLMVTDIALLMRRNRGGRSRARHPQGQLPRVGEAPPVPGEEGRQGFQQQFASWAVDISLLLAPLQEPWILTTGAGGALRGLEMT